MSSKPENQYIAGLHKHLPPLKELYREKMANPWRGGTADWWYSGAAADLWIEFKFVEELPVRAPLVPALSPLQLEWCTRRRAEGRSVIVVVGTRGGYGVVFDDPATWAKGGGLTPPEASMKRYKNAQLAQLISRHCLEGASLCSTPLPRSSAASS